MASAASGSGLGSGGGTAAEPPAPAPTHTNRLAKEQSPYLLQHAHNPVREGCRGSGWGVRQEAQQKGSVADAGGGATTAR